MTRPCAGLTGWSGRSWGPQMGSRLRSWSLRCVPGRDARLFARRSEQPVCKTRIHVGESPPQKCCRAHQYRLARASTFGSPDFVLPAEAASRGSNRRRAEICEGCEAAKAGGINGVASLIPEFAVVNVASQMGKPLLYSTLVALSNTA